MILAFLHVVTSQFDAVVRIEGPLDARRCGSGVCMARARLASVVGFVFEGGEFLSRERQLRRHILMFWDFRLSVGMPAICIVSGLVRTNFLRWHYRLKTAPIV